MKKIFICIMALFLIAGCGKKEEVNESLPVVYTEGMFTDVREWDFYRDAVEFCINEGYMTGEGETFGAYSIISKEECAYIMAKINGAHPDNPKDYVVKNSIAPTGYKEWEKPVTREDVAYMLSRILKGSATNLVVEGAISDVEDSYAKEEIYTLYRMGIFSGDKKNSTFRPKENMVKAEMAIVIHRAVNKEKRVRFDMNNLEVTMVAFGDVIGHTPVLNAGKTETGYNFDKAFEPVRDYVLGKDIACVNQETIFTENNFTGYPAFGSPKEIGIAEVNAGFDVICHGTNHAYDKSEEGILYSVNFWKDYDVEMLGIHESREDADKISVIEKNGVKIALLNYTETLNGYRLPQGKEYLVDVLSEEKVKSDMDKAKSVSDAIVVFVHWGNEYQNEPSEAQRQWAQLLADWGATVIVGHHPHVVQPFEYVESGNRSVPVYYSLGNFISSQTDYQNALGAVADFKIVKTTAGTVAKDCEIIPLVTHMQKGDYSAYLLSEYPEEKEKTHRHRANYGTRFSKEAYSEVFNEIMG